MFRVGGSSKIGKRRASGVDKGWKGCKIDYFVRLLKCSCVYPFIVGVLLTPFTQNVFRWRGCMIEWN